MRLYDVIFESLLIHILKISAVELLTREAVVQTSKPMVQHLYFLEGSKASSWR